MLRRIWITRRPAGLAAGLAAVLATVSAPAVAEGSHEVALRFQAPATFRMYDADEGAGAANSDFVLPVAKRSAGGPARNVKVVVDTSGLKGGRQGGEGRLRELHRRRPGVHLRVRQPGERRRRGQQTLNPPRVDGVEPGDSGTVTYTATADNAAPVTGTTRMTVGGPTLHSPGKEKAVKGVEPGKSVPLTPSFANHSRFTTEQGVALLNPAASWA